MSREPGYETPKAGELDPLAPHNTIFILGAPDPEMEAIEELLRENGWSYAYLGIQDPNGEPGSGMLASLRPDWRFRRVTPAEAYQVDAGTHDLMPGHSAEGGPQWPLNVVAVECDGKAWTVPETAWGCGGYSIGYTVVDHHRPGDPGFGRAPEEFFPASSLGQVLQIVTGRELRFESLSMYRPQRGEYARGWWKLVDPGTPQRGAYHGHPIDRDLVMVGAADHCLGAAYASECPGVDPEELFEFRVRRLAKAAPGREARTEEDVRVSIESAQQVLRAAAEWYPSMPPDPAVDAPDSWVVKDLRGQGVVPDLPEAACRLGVGYVADAPVRNGERQKVVIGGCGLGTVPGTEPIEHFLRHVEVGGQYFDAYGDPVRGFAGASKSPSLQEEEVCHE